MGENMADKKQPSESPLTAEFGEFVKKQLDEWRVPGLSIGVLDGDNIYTEGYGIATFPDTPATAETVWYGASTTKAFVGAVLAHLIDSKKHPELAKGWATPISSIIRDDFVLRDTWATEHLTLEDAVCHRTGFPRHDKSLQRYIEDEHGPIVEPDGRRKRYATIKDVVRNLRNVDLTEQPRVKFQYCNLMFVVLSHVIETLTGKPLEQVMHEVIWDPLGMTSTYFDLDKARAGPNHFARGYNFNKDNNKFEQMPWMPVRECSGAGAIMSNVIDYAKWMKCLINQSEPFSEAAHKDIRTPRIIQRLPGPGMDGSLYGLGWERTVYRNHVIYAHGGGTHAYGAQVYWLPEDKFGVVAFANTAITSNALQDVLVYKLINDKLGIAPENRFDPGRGWHGIIDHHQQNDNKGLDLLFPDRPEKPLPSPVDIKELAGTYYDSGYKSITLSVKPHPNREDEVILVADLPNTTWQFRLELHHVSGSWWIAYVNQGLESSVEFFKEWEKAEFKIGPNGKPTALVIEWWARLGNMYEGLVEFRRIQE
ncbi:beta-lactamase/transpeptidase-like protein [Mariannaea sp. PMI_226]|nr:beta-lactamase/transpeptidase-like protein [Mariannaea sp. PMI_226]